MDGTIGKNPSLQAKSPPTRSRSESALDDGDLHLLRWMLELTSTERLRVAQGFANDVLKLRNARRA